MESKKATVILYDLCIFINFRERLYKDYPVIATMISSYFNYNMLVKGSEVFAGSSIIGYLLKEHNENSVRPYVDRLLNGQELNSMNMKMIGGGGSCLVYKINELTAQFYHENLYKPTSKEAQEYIKKRKLDNKTLKAFSIGFSSPAYNDLYNHLKKNKHKHC